MLTSVPSNCMTNTRCAAAPFGDTISTNIGLAIASTKGVRLLSDMDEDNEVLASGAPTFTNPSEHATRRGYTHSHSRVSQLLKVTRMSFLSRCAQYNINFPDSNYAGLPSNQFCGGQAQAGCNIASQLDSGEDFRTATSYPDFTLASRASLPPGWETIPLDKILQAGMGGTPSPGDPPTGSPTPAPTPAPDPTSAPTPAPTVATSTAAPTFATRTATPTVATSTAAPTFATSTAAPTVQCVSSVLTLATTLWAAEISWDIDGSIGPTKGLLYVDNTAYTQALCLSPGGHTLKLKDAFGDGWHGGTISIEGCSSALLASTALSDGLKTTAGFAVPDLASC